MLYLGIDPGPEMSALILYDPVHQFISLARHEVNGHAMKLLDDIYACKDSQKTTICEWIDSYGMPVGKSTFETVYWIGKFSEHADPFIRIARRDVKLHLCGSMRAKDANVRQALIDRFPATGGGKIPQIGTKKQLGPLYGVSSHLWAALGVVITHVEQAKQAGR